MLSVDNQVVVGFRDHRHKSQPPEFHSKDTIPHLGTCEALAVPSGTGSSRGAASPAPLVNLSKDASNVMKATPTRFGSRRDNMLRT